MSTMPLEGTIVAPEVQQKTLEEITALATRAYAIKRIETPEQFETVAGIGVEAARRLIEAHVEYDPVCESTHAAWKSATALRAKAVDPLEAVKKYAGALTLEYSRRKEAERKAEEDRLRREEEERQRQIAIKQAEDDKLALAQRLQDEGKTAEAEAELAAPVQAPDIYVAPVVLESSVPQVQGAGGRENWQAEVVDLMKLVKAVAEGKVPLLAIEANETHLRQQAKSMKSLLNYPGVRAYDKGTAVFRTK